MIAQISAQNIAFDNSTITKLHSKGVKVDFANSDIETAHGFSGYNSGNSSATPNGSISAGHVITGVNTITYIFTEPNNPEAYFFRFDVHPTVMAASVVVS